MIFSMHTASASTWKSALMNLSGLLEKAMAHAEAHKIAPEILLGARLYPDMFPLVRQVQIASDLVKGGCARLAGIEVPKYEDNEASFDDLQRRIQKTITFIDTIKPQQIDGSEARDITLHVGQNTYEFKGLDYLLNFVNPNLYFHISIAYAILRHNGVSLSKGDYLGRR